MRVRPRGAAKVLPSGGQTFLIEEFSKIDERENGKAIGNVFEALDHHWKLVVYKNDTKDHLSVFLEIVTDDLQDSVNWSVPAGITFTVVHPTNPLENRILETSHKFNEDETDWGYCTFMKLEDVEEFLKDDSLKITVSVHKHVTADISATLGSVVPYNSKEETGMVGLKNQGATCYMNSLLQTLFHMGAFRQAVYSMPTEKDDSNEIPTIPLALQRVFYRLQFGSRSVCTKELTKSFGWDISDAFTQHDVQELNRVLCDNLEGKMKNTCSEGTIEYLFKGTSLSYISCTEVEYTSKRTEEFYDISLNVRNCDNIYQSFDKYTEEEIMEGENKYMAEGFGLQTARKGIKFLSFPPVLFIQLKRFEFDYSREMMIKINDKFEFPPDLDLSSYMSEDSMEKSECNRYRLYSVLVHNGDVYGGHYYSFQRPHSKSSDWYKFDDDRVTRATIEQAIDHNFGGEQVGSHTNGNTKKLNQHANAYLLVYIRESQVDEILLDEDKLKIPEHIKNKFEEESLQEERLRAQRHEAKQYVEIEIATIETFKKYPQTPYFGLFEFSLSPPLHSAFRIRRDATVNELKSIAMEYFGVPQERQRLWKWIERGNDTYRIYRPLDQIESEKTIEEVSKNKNLWRLFLEEIPEQGGTSALTLDFKKNLCIFLKYYSRVEEKLEMVGSFIFSCQLTPTHLKEYIIHNIFKLPEFDGEIYLYEEFTPNELKPLPRNSTLQKLEILSGDIIVFEINLPGTPHMGVMEYYEYFANRIAVEVYPLPTGNEGACNESFSIELLRTMSYSQMEETIAKRLRCDPRFCRFTHSTGERPHTHPLLKSENLHTTVDELLVTTDNYFIPTLYYEILDVPLTELETKKIMLIQWQNEKTETMKTVKLLVPKNEKFEYVLRELPNHVELKFDTGIRLMEVIGHKISRILPKHAAVNHDFVGSIVAEEIRPEEANKQSGDRILNISHAWSGPEGKQSLRYFGNPFRCLSKKGETVKEFMGRIRERLDLANEDMKGWSCVVVAYKDRHFLDDDDMISDHQFHSHTQLVLHHINRNATNRSHVFEKPIKIYN